MTTVRVQLGKAYGLCPWSAAGIGGWTWAQIWLAYRHEVETMEAAERARKKAERESRRSRGRGEAREMSFAEWNATL